MDMDDNSNERVLDHDDHATIEALATLAKGGNLTALGILNERFQPGDLDENETWQAARSTARRQQEMRERDEADRKAHEASLRGASRIAEILRRGAGL